MASKACSPRVLWWSALAATVTLTFAFSSAHAETRTLTYLTGTGFFVTQQGYILTNNHVVQNCKDVDVQGAVPLSRATIVDRDEKNDLALLHTEAFPPSVAALRPESRPPERGERVMSVGYPGAKALTTLEATVLSPTGPTNEPQWLQFTSSVSQGNSGGPLFDTGGNVIGVIVAKVKLTTTVLGSRREETSRISDIAIQLPIIRDFLRKNYVYARESSGGARMDTTRIQDKARDYVVQVRCLQ